MYRSYKPQFRAIFFQVVRPTLSMCSPQSYQDMSSSVKLSSLHQVKHHVQTILSSVTIGRGGSGQNSQYEIWLTLVTPQHCS